MTKTRSVGHLLNNSTTGLAKVVRRTKELQKLTATLKDMVDAPLSNHIYVANIRDQTLVIGTDSAIWHTRIKYLGPVILEQIRQLPGLERLQHIEFRIQPLTNQAHNDKFSGLPQNDRPVGKDTAQSEDYLQQLLQRIEKKKEQH